jgi:hypothetical protein
MRPNENLVDSLVMKYLPEELPAKEGSTFAGKIRLQRFPPEVFSQN